MGIGSAMLGGNPADGRQALDFYPTPEDVTLALLEVEAFDALVYEPACGDGAIAKVLEERGHIVCGTDIEPRGYGSQADFFSLEGMEDGDLVSNPPFNLAEAFIRHAMTRLRPRKMALVLKSSFFHAKGRRPLFEEYPPAAIYPLTWRPDFLGKGAPVLEVAWFVWERGHKGATVYRPLSRPPGFTGNGRGRVCTAGAAPRATLPLEI